MKYSEDYKTKRRVWQKNARLRKQAAKTLAPIADTVVSTKPRVVPVIVVPLKGKEENSTFDYLDITKIYRGPKLTKKQFTERATKRNKLKRQVANDAVAINREEIDLMAKFGIAVFYNPDKPYIKLTTRKVIKVQRPDRAHLPQNGPYDWNKPLIIPHHAENTKADK